MEAFARPVRALQAQLAYFARARELRLLSVCTTGDLRPAVLQMVAATELHPDNRAPFVVLEDAVSPENTNWDERAERLRIAHERRREALALDGEELAELPDPPSALNAAAAFLNQLRQVADAKPAWMEGFVVVLAPARVEDPGAFADVVRALVEAPALADVRWVVVDLDAVTVAPVLDRLGDRARRIHCAADEAAAQAELGRMLDAAAAAPPGASGPARVGAAWPRGVAAPARLGRPLPEDDVAVEAMLREAGIDAPLAGPAGTALARNVLGAARCLRAGNGPDAVRLQRDARDLCLARGMLREGTLMELILGAYLVQADQRPAAVETYSAAALRAEAHGLGDLAAQAHMAIGALQALALDRDRAAASYARGGAAARDAGMSLLAIEGFRMAGFMSLEGGRPAQAVKAWQEALAQADHAPPAEAHASSAAEAARALAALCRAQGLEEQAEGLEARAEELEAPLGPPAPPLEGLREGMGEESTGLFRPPLPLREDRLVDPRQDFFESAPPPSSEGTATPPDQQPTRVREAPRSGETS